MSPFHARLKTGWPGGYGDRHWYEYGHPDRHDDQHHDRRDCYEHRHGQLARRGFEKPGTSSQPAGRQRRNSPMPTNLRRNPEFSKLHREKADLFLQILCTVPF
jgi:hypothetical protein